MAAMADGKGAQFNMRNPAVKRILQEVKEMQREGSKEYASMPLEEDIFEWQFAIHGPKDTEFEGGIYHGRITLPAEYPFKPPSFMLLTPSGRFEVQTKICLSISNHHPEHWQPSWSVRTALVALIAFMPTKPDGALGSLDYTKDERRQLAIKSRLAPPKFGSPGRQQVIDQIHSAMLQTAPPIPATLQPASSPAPMAPDTPQDPPATPALPPAADPSAAASDSAASSAPASSAGLPVEQPHASSPSPQPAAAQAGESPSTTLVEPATAGVASGPSSGSDGLSEIGTGLPGSSYGSISTPQLAQAGCTPGDATQSAAAAGASSAPPADVVAAAAGAASAGSHLNAVDHHSLAEPLLPPQPQSMTESRPPRGATAAAAAHSGAEARAGGAVGSAAGQTQTRVAEGRGRGGRAAAGEDRVLSTLAAAIVVAIMALLLRKFLRVYSPLDEASMEW
ncbi:hypothetical protein CLOM_g22429 [Closterium sp. NIES-68]|nr:hypothetical protein CLOM_g22429 [Closterium sp. NIES-68]GJP70227.1 hypothetical protein CLOP_g1192 [Closterium sp. NIES-67]